MISHLAESLTESHPAESLSTGSSLRNARWRTLISDNQWNYIATTLRLAPRELQVAQLIFEGKTIAGTAYELGLSLGTVKTYLARIYSKVGAHDQRELVLAIVEVIITPNHLSSIA
jgi:DNA-binding NarL/FixJ family response regulator